MEETVKERLIHYLKYKKIGRNKFENMSGISNGYISNIKNAPGSLVLEKILTAAPDLNRNWLLTGKGEMLKTSPNNNIECTTKHETHMIPMIPTSAHGGSLSDFVISVKPSECEKVISPIKGADFAIPVTGDSMAPEYPNGSQVHIKKINERAFIEWGKVYVLDTCNGVVIKRLVPADEEGYIRCVSINPQPIYAPFNVAMSDIYGIYRVMLCLSIK